VQRDLIEAMQRALGNADADRAIEGDPQLGTAVRLLCGSVCLEILVLYYFSAN
jgi:hypothetical protein